MSDDNYQDDLNYETEEEDDLTNMLSDKNEAYDDISNIELYGNDQYTKDQYNELIRIKEQKLLALLKDEGLININTEDFNDPLTNDFLDAEISNPNISKNRKEALDKLKVYKDKYLGNFSKK